MYNQQLVYDVGMHNGDDTANYLSQGFQVVSIEADPTLADMGKERFKEYIESGKLQILNIGIANENGYLEFYVNEKVPEWNSFHLSVASRDGLPWYSIQVQTRTFDRVINEYGVPFYLKVDIEGNDYLCVEALDPANLPKYISVEASDISILNSLAQRGFSRFKLIFQYNLAHLDPKPNKYFKRWLWACQLRLGNSFFMKAFRKLGGSQFIHWLDNYAIPNYSKSFKKGSSGNFAEHLGGQWYSFDETKDIFQYYHTLFHNLPNKKDYGFWVDIHATW
jgi:FkbM family methyltransferase